MEFASHTRPLGALPGEQETQPAPAAGEALGDARRLLAVDQGHQPAQELRMAAADDHGAALQRGA
ncbi:hypothetical protein SBADM41S_05641 [Streptomyces badius]